MICSDLYLVINLDKDIESLVKQVAALHCADEPLQLIPSKTTIAVVLHTKLVGKLFRPRNLGRQLVRSILQRSWDREHSWMIFEERPNLSIFIFKMEMDQ